MDDDAPCYRHPNELTALRCVTCDRPICIDCAISAPVGFKCPDHGRTSRAERGVIPATRLARGAGAGALVAVVAGVTLSLVPIPMFGIVLAYVAGLGIGEVARRASGGFRDPLLARCAAIAAFVSFVALPAFWIASGEVLAGAWVAWRVLAAAAAAWAAHSRTS